jgi:hypothetical protein
MDDASADLLQEFGVVADHDGGAAIAFGGDFLRSQTGVFTVKVIGWLVKHD